MQQTDISEKARKWQFENFGERYVGASLSEIRAPEWAQHKIGDWINNPKNFLVYLGSPGIGKTFLCAALAEFYFRRFSSRRYHKERDLYERIIQVIQSGSSNYKTELKYLVDDEIVIIDDIGSEKYTEHREEVIFEIIDQRYNSMLPTIITSNYSIEEFKEIYHKRVASRLFSKENTVIEILDGEDFRQ